MSHLRILAASGGVHAADQLLFAALPLVAALAGADPLAIGVLVALQSAAWFCVSLPAGALADRFARGRLLRAGAALTMCGASAALAAWLSAAPLLWLGLAAFVATSGVVLAVLTIFAIVPTVTPARELPAANAAIELVRAVVTLAAPVVAAGLIARGQAGWAFALAIAAGLVATAAAAGPAAAPPPAASRRDGTFAAIAAGIAFTRGNPLLTAIAACAIFWNLGFLALAALLAPWIIRIHALAPDIVGFAWSSYGAGLVLGALAAPQLLRRWSPATALIFGPAVSVAAAALIALTTRSQAVALIATGFFLIGFGPMIWLVNQTSLRQRVTPPAMLGRVGATIQFAIYGVRPFGALIAGVAAQQFGLEAAIWLPVGLFAASLAAILRLLVPALAVIEARPAPAATGKVSIP